jgi:Family of unknown function (DUF5686)/CarboxypepD_reg-like domain
MSSKIDIIKTLGKLFLFLLFTCFANAQQCFVRGRVLDYSTKEPLSFTNIRVAGTTYGASANKDGEYELKVNPGKYVLIASYIGYKSDTLIINVKNNVSNLDFHLNQTNITLPDIVIVPGEDPAISIIKNALARKQERNKKLNSYEYEAYTKAILKTEDEISIKGRHVSTGFGGSDSSNLKISAIIENQSKTYFKKPDNYKEIIIARKQSANLPPTLNIFTGGRLIQNFYDNTMQFSGSDLPGPLADNALNYYDFYLKNISAINDRSVYEIFMTPSNSSNPGFEGYIYIIDGTYDLIKVDLTLNKAANIGGIFDTINVVQQFSMFSDSIYMPVDYHLLVKINYLGLARFGFELTSSLYDYKINPKIDDSFFNKAVVTVLPDADKKDSVYWKDTQTIPNTSEEELAYKRIDSLSRTEESFGDRFSILSSTIDWGNNFSTSAPLGMYHFNRVEGHAFDFDFNSSNLMDDRIFNDAHFSYGTADDRFKSSFSSRYLMGDYRTYRISFEAFNDIKILFGQSDNYRKLSTTLLALLLKEDFRDYYYSKGFNIDFRGEVFPVLRLNLGFSNTTDKNAFENTSVSIFNSGKRYRANPPIYETKINSITAGFRVDFRDYIENGLYRMRTTLGKSYIIFDGDVIYSSPAILNSDERFTKYELSVFGRLNSFRSTYLNYRIYGMYNNGYLPYQMMYALPGDINLVAHSYTFRTLEYNEVTGDRVVTLNLDYNFRSELFRLLHIPGLEDWDIQLNTFFNAAYSEVSPDAASILPNAVNTFKSPFYEIGFGLAHALIPLKVEFGWKLNHRGENNFRVGFNMFMF